MSTVSNEDMVKQIRLKIYNDYFVKCLEHPNLSKEEICKSFNFCPGTIDHIRKEYGCQSPFFFKNIKGGGKKLTEDQKLSRYVKTQQTKLNKEKRVELEDKLKKYIIFR